MIVLCLLTQKKKPKHYRGNWMKYCTVSKSMGRGTPIWTSVVVCARVACALWPVRSIPVALFLPSQCAERCANDAFLTSLRATLSRCLYSVQLLCNLSLEKVRLLFKCGFCSIYTRLYGMCTICGLMPLRQHCKAKLEEGKNGDQGAWKR